MQRKFITNLILLLFLNLLIKPFWILGIDRSVQNLVGAESYGFYFTIFNFSFLFNILLDLGITNFNNRNIAQNEQLLNKHFSGILIIKILLALLYFVVTFGVALLIGYKGDRLYLLLWVGINQFLLSFILYLRSNISGLLMFRTDSLISVLDRLLMILFCGILIWGGVSGFSFTIEWFVYMQTLAYSITFLVALIIVIRKAAFRRLHWNRAFFMVIIRQSLPFALLVLLMTVYYRSDAILIERILGGELGDKQSGIYAQAFRLLDAANMIPMLFAVLLMPMFSRMIKENGNVKEMVRLSWSMLFSLSVLVSVGSVVYSRDLMELLYIENIDDATAIFGKIIFSFIAVSSIYVFGALLTANGNLKALNIISIAALLVNIIVNLILIPQFMARGAAWANLLTQFTAAIPQIWLAHRIFNLRWELRYLLTLAVYAAGILILSFISRVLPFSWEINFIFFLVAGFILSFALKLIHVRGLLAIIRNK
ncbi:MAG: oligosaccharide flippase family protein [Bacteroidetes bacterium]|nr:oligosaccharide flippase family protein [Bacteroidota bacterium]